MMTHSQSFFELPNTPDFYCKLQGITEDKVLNIEVFKTNVGGKRYLIQIQNVVAINIPILWRAPAFELASDLELLQLARSVNDNNLSKLSDSDVLARYFLYKVPNPNSSEHEDTMYILAGEAVVQEKTSKSKHN